MFPVEIKQETQDTFAVRVITKTRLEDGPFKAYYRAVKVQGAKFTGAPRYAWIVPSLSVASIVSGLQASGLFAVNLDDAARDACVVGITKLAEQGARMAEREAANDGESCIARVAPALARKGFKLFDHQKLGIRWLASRTSGLLADEMGLGKTLQVTAAIRSCAVIVCPSVAKGVWKQEIETYRPDLRVTILDGRGSFRWPTEGEVIVTNFDILPKPPADAKTNALAVYTSPTVPPAPEGCDVIADEAHLIAHNKSMRSLSFRMLAACAKRAHGRALEVTATPLESRPPQLWALLTNVGVAKEAFGSYDRFASLFGYTTNPGGYGYWEGPKASDKAEIAACLDRVMLRRLQSEALDLPARTFQTLKVELSAATVKVCDKYLASLTAQGRTIDDVLASDASIGFEAMSRVRSMLASAKIPAMMEQVESYEDAGEPLMILSAHRAPIDALRGRPGWCVITGDENAEQKEQIARDFQAGKYPHGVALTIAAGGVAITLHRAAHALVVDYAWNPTANDQALARIYRIGQERPVTVKSLVASHPIDERVAEIRAWKSEMISNSIEGVVLCELHEDCRASKALAMECHRRTKIAESKKIDMINVPTVDFSALLTEAQVEVEKVRIKREAEAGKAKRRHEGKRARYAGAASEAAHPAENDIEAWAQAGILSLYAMCDGVHAKDGAGFSVATRTAGAWLFTELHATGGNLTPQGWRMAVAVCRQHQGQIGVMPNVSESK